MNARKIKQNLKFDLNRYLHCVPLVEVVCLAYRDEFHVLKINCNLPLKLFENDREYKKVLKNINIFVIM